MQYLNKIFFSLSLLWFIVTKIKQLITVTKCEEKYKKMNQIK